MTALTAFIADAVNASIGSSDGERVACSECKVAGISLAALVLPGGTAKP
jgi:hypothetical protein